MSHQWNEHHIEEKKELHHEASTMHSKADGELTHEHGLIHEHNKISTSDL